ncbi:MAG: TRAP transporter fused permease subunit [Acidobacteria bacterium]|nr:TRAP transporter fused permease subunit [Acidobacteriota bacterium]
MEGLGPAAEGAGTTRPLRGWQRGLGSLLSASLAGYALYWVLFIVQPQIYRVSFLLIALVLTFLYFPARRRDLRRPEVRPLDWALIAGAVAALSWPLVDFDRFVYRAAEPQLLDLVFGGVAILLVLEATRRTVGWVLPITALAFLAYAWLGQIFDSIGLSLIAHRGYGLDRLIGTLYITLEGLFGVPLDVAATYIILFTIYGAVLEASGAARFFIDWALAASGRSAAAPGRSVTLAGFLLGTVSGSGVATTVMLGSVAWPLLRRAGYAADTAGAMLSSAGIGALLSPPTLGAAAFLIAEFLQISYLQVLVMATVPTVLYYLSIFVMIESDARRAAPVEGSGEGAPARLGELTRKYWYHFTSLIAIAVFMIVGMSAFRAVFWAMLLAVGLGYLRPETALTPRRLFNVLGTGGRDVLGVAATTATAGIIVGVVTLTGLGLKLAGVIVALSGGTLFLTVAYSAIAVWLLGLAVPVTASYIIAAVMIAPALVTSGVPDYAAHMFIFYYAVLSEVSPPTALSPFAAAALTGGNPFRTMLLTWKYTLPAFVVPFVFTLSDAGAGLLLRGSRVEGAVAAVMAAAGITAIAAAVGGGTRRRSSGVERVALGTAGVLMLFITGPLALAGMGLVMVVLVLHFARRSASRGVRTES